MPELIRVGQKIYSWNSLRFTVDLIPISGLTSIDWDQKRERKVVYGMRRDGTPLGKTSGKYIPPNFSIKFLADDYDTLTTYLTAKGLGSYGDAEFTMSLQAIEETSGLPITLNAGGCTIDGEKDGYAEGSDELVTEVQIGALSFTRNGKSLWSIARSIL